MNVRDACFRENLYSLVECGTKCQKENFQFIEENVFAMGFDYVSYGIKMPIPLTKFRAIMISNYPDAWQARYDQADYIQIDPVVLKGLKTIGEQINWTDSLFSNARQFWEEAQSYGIKYGLSRSSRLGSTIGMLSASRHNTSISPEELAHIQDKFYWLAQVAHITLSHVLSENIPERNVILTKREIEVLKWTADGKSAYDISMIFGVSKNTIDFHIKNCIAKLNTTNKVAATVKAVSLGLLST